MKKEPRVKSFNTVVNCCNDGHTRMTNVEGMRVIGGTEKCHEHEVETRIRVQEGLKRDGKTLRDIGPTELMKRMQEAEGKNRS